jgi:hypothetical protein
MVLVSDRSLLYSTEECIKENIPLLHINFVNIYKNQETLGRKNNHNTMYTKKGIMRNENKNISVRRQSNLNLKAEIYNGQVIYHSSMAFL